MSTVPFTFEPLAAAGLTLSRLFRTEVHVSEPGSEQRERYDGEGRWQLRYQVDTNAIAETQALRYLLDQLQAKDVAIPFWPGMAWVASIDGTTITTESPLRHDWNVKQAVLFNSPTDYEVVTLTAAAGDTVTLAGAPSIVPGPDLRIIPWRVGYIEKDPDLAEPTAEAGDLELTWVEKHGNRRTAPAAYEPQLFAGRAVMPFWPSGRGGVTSGWDAAIDLRELGFGNPDRIARNEITVRHRKLPFQFSDLEPCYTVEDWWRWVEFAGGEYMDFWLPEWQANHDVVRDIEDGAESLYVAAGLAAWFNQRAGYQFICIASADGVQPLKIHTVATEDEEDPLLVAGVERIDLVDPVSGAHDRREVVLCWLLCARFAKSELALTYDTLTSGSGSFEFVELPWEYSAASVGARPIYLYEFKAKNPSSSFATLRYTSYYEAIEAGGKTFGYFNLSHGAIKRDGNAVKHPVDVELIDVAGTHPLRAWTRGENDEVLEVTIWQTTATAPALDNQLVRSSMLRVEADDKEKLIVEVASILRIMEQKTGRGFGSPTCPHKLFGGLCGLAEADWRESGEIGALGTTANGQPYVQLALTGARAASFFQLGKAKVGNEIQTINRAELAAGVYTLYLSLPFRQAEIGLTLYATAGCDRTYGTCLSKFSNRVNFGGEPFTPADNPVIEEVEIDTEIPGFDK